MAFMFCYFVFYAFCFNECVCEWAGAEMNGRKGRLNVSGLFVRFCVGFLDLLIYLFMCACVCLFVNGQVQI